MAGNKERTKDDLYIKKQEDRKSKRFFVTGSSKDGDTILASSFNKASESFAANQYLDDNYLGYTEGGLVYALQQMKEDLDDVYNEVSASAFEASFFPFARIDSGSFGVISSSLVPGIDSKYDLGSVTREWNDIFIDGTANIDSLAMGTTVTAIRDEDNMSSDSATSLATQQSIKAYVDANAGGDLTAVDSHIVPDGDNTRDLGSKSKEFKDLYIDGTAYIDTLAGGALTQPIRTVLSQVTSMKNTTLDAQKTDVFEFNSSKALTVDLIVPMFPGQEITIMNIGSGAITITGASSPKQTGIYNGKNANYTINQHQAYKFVVNSNQIWYVL